MRTTNEILELAIDIIKKHKLTRSKLYHLAQNFLSERSKIICANGIDENDNFINEDLLNEKLTELEFRFLEKAGK